MKTKDYHYIHRLKSELEKRQMNNKNYSLRAFSRDLGVNPAAMSLILRGKRDLPLNTIDQVIKSLHLDSNEETLFKESRMLNPTNINVTEMDRYILDESYYNIIAEWEHFAILALFDVSDYLATEESIARDLDISIERTNLVLNNLLNHELIKLVDGYYQPIHLSLRTTEDIESQALHDSHLETLELATAKINSTSITQRDYSSETLAIDASQINEYKKLIREFRYKVADLAKQQKTNEVFQLAIQFFPLSSTQKEQK